MFKESSTNMQINAPLSQLRPNDFTESIVCSEQLIKYSPSPLDNVVKNASNTITTINTRRLISMPCSLASAVDC